MSIFEKIIADYNDALKTECNNYAIWLELGVKLYTRFEPEKTSSKLAGKNDGILR